MSSESGSPPQEPIGKDAGKKASAKARDVNTPLRRAYESVIDETIPQSMMDLLNKLN